MIPVLRATSVAAASALLLAACSAAAPSAAPAPSSSARAASSAPPPIASPTPSATSTLTTAQPLGVPVPSGGGLVAVTVYAYKQPVAKTATQPDQQGFTWGAADVQVCYQPSGTQPTISVGNAAWSLVYADNSTIGPSDIEYRQFPLPDYPFADHVLTKGRCVRGWITFPVPGSTWPRWVEYAPAGSTPVDWLTR